MDNNSRVISDFIGYLNITPKMLAEAEKTADGKVLIQGVLQRANALNQNKRIYSRELLLREANKFQKKIDEKLSGGELDHPDSPIVNLKNVSHAVRKMWWDGDNLNGVIEVIPTPSGNIVKDLIRSDIQLGVSSRGIGTTKQGNDDSEIVQEDFELLTFDIVSQPSTQGAYLNPMNENVDPKVKDKRDKYNKINEIINYIISNI